MCLNIRTMEILEDMMKGPSGTGSKHYNKLTIVG